LKNILANASVFPGIAIADLPAVYSSVDFMRAIMMRTNNVGNTDYADADPIKFVPAIFHQCSSKQWTVICRNG
jgi:hypothetical protein